MVKKKGGKKKKSRKGSKQGQDEEPQEPTFEVPEFLPSRIDPRSLTANIKLAAPVCPELDFTAQVTLSTSIADIARVIRKRHGGAIQQVQICLSRFHPDEVISDITKSLETLGVKEESTDCLIYYDFVPTTDPLIA